jgi:O-antigen biosynthesis protein
MQLSIVIVNYNVKYFLEQCLISVFKACQNLEAEVFVVDNNSVDGSIGMVRNRFPEVKLITNTSNAGFARANNQAIRQATGEFTLLLNPDTLVEEHCFEKCISFMNGHPEAGAIGIKMIDGKGKFLPESKRSFPSPSIAFYKIFGLSALFPKSHRFGKYHLSYLDKDKTHAVEVLSGAFMFMRTAALLKAGMLDEDYFMYGEDIDLSYTIKNAGYSLYYYPEATIIHYKGESTRKGSLNYVFTFYQAMLIFAEKHFNNRKARIFSVVIKFAIYFRASISVLHKILLAILLPLVEFCLLFCGYLIVLPFWQRFILGDRGQYPSLFLHVMVPAYILVWLSAVLFSGGYDRPVKLTSLIKGYALGTALILVVYALLPLSLRFSRALIFFGAIWGLLTGCVARLLLNASIYKGTLLSLKPNKRILVAGNQAEAGRVADILQSNHRDITLIGMVSPSSLPVTGEYMGNLDQLGDIVRINGVDEIIFCAKDISSREIIRCMLALSGSRLEYKIAPQEGLSIIGSNSVDSPGEIYVLEYNLIAKPGNRRVKRLFDVFLASLLLLLSPLLAFFYKHPVRFLSNCFKVLAGMVSWVGYTIVPDAAMNGLPVIRKGVLNPLSSLKSSTTIEQIERSNILYARDYSLTNDLKIIRQGFLRLDNDSGMETKKADT